MLLIAAFSYPSASASSSQLSRRNALNSWSSVQARHLAPAYPHSGLRKRQPGGLLRKEANLDFVDHAAHLSARSNEPVLVTNLDLRSKYPTLSLEDLEDGLIDVTCFESGIKLTFSSPEYMEGVKRELAGTTEFVAISSHWGCNEDEERAPHMVTNVTVDKEENSITLSRKDVQWKEAFHTINVSFSHKRSNSVVRRSQRPANPIRRRSRTPGTSSSSTPTVPETVFPPVPTSEARFNNGSAKIDVSHKNKQLVPPELPGVSLLGLPEGITLSCKECSINGALELSAGSFSMGDDEDDSGLLSALAFINEGKVEIELSSLFARVELELALEAGQELLNFTVPMPSVPLSPFAIPGVVLFGAIFTPQVSVAVTLSNPVNFTYGVDVSVPEDSGFSLNFGDLSNSTIKGLEYTTFTEIPFQSSKGVTDLTFSVSFSPEILFGVESPTGIIKGGAGVTFNVPQASVKVSQLHGVDERCEKVTKPPEIENDTDKHDFVDILIGDFVNIEPSFGFEVVPFVELQLKLPRNEALHYQKLTATSTEFSLPTACLAFDEKVSTYGAPTQVLATSTAEPTATASETKKAAAGRVSMANVWTLLCLSVLAAAMFNAC
ncbi:hypothetical protein McanCB49686_002214 [Microsporum canis]